MAAESERRRNGPESSASFYNFFHLKFSSTGTRKKGETKRTGQRPTPPCTRSSERRLLLHLMMIKRSANVTKEESSNSTFSSVFTFFGINYANEQAE
jgi:hypothetical protein